MKSVVLGSRSRSGLAAVADCYLTGVEERPTKGNPDRTYFSAHLASEPDGRPLYCFTDEDVAAKAVEVLTKAGAPVRITAEVRLSSTAINLDAFEVAS